MNVKLAACLYSQKFRCGPITSVLSAGLFEELSKILKERGIFTDDAFCTVILPLRWRFDNIMCLPDFFTLPSGKHFKQLLEPFTPGYLVGTFLQGLGITREETAKHLSKPYNHQCTDYDWSCDASILMTRCIGFSYNEPKSYA